MNGKPKETALVALFICIAFVALSCNTDDGAETGKPTTVETPSIIPAEDSEHIVATHSAQPGEIHFGKLFQLTNGGENAEAYFNQRGDKLIFQSSRDGVPCDQIYMMNIDGSGLQKISEGGRTTCSFIAGNNDYLLYASTFEQGAECPHAELPQDGGYSWFLYNYDIFRADMDGSNPVNLTNSPNSYDAEGAISPDGKEIVFSSTRNGDQEIYIMNADGSNVRQITDSLGYDGGPFYSWDGSKIVFRSYRPKTEEDIAAYKDALSKGLMRRVPLEIYVMDSDGSNIQQVTDLGRASFAPYMHPDGKRIIFCSNYGDSPRIFNLFMINIDGTGLEQITYNESFDGFPMFSKDGKYLVFCSNRHAEDSGNTNVFITEWMD